MNTNKQECLKFLFVFIRVYSWLTLNPPSTGQNGAAALIGRE